MLKGGRDGWALASWGDTNREGARGRDGQQQNLCTEALFLGHWRYGRRGRERELAVALQKDKGVCSAMSRRPPKNASNVPRVYVNLRLACSQSQPLQSLFIPLYADVDLKPEGPHLLLTSLVTPTLLLSFTSIAHVRCLPKAMVPTPSAVPGTTPLALPSSVHQPHCGCCFHSSCASLAPERPRMSRRRPHRRAR